MRSVKFKTLAIIFGMALMVCFFPFESHAEEKSVLMFLWQGETGAEQGFKDALKEEFPDQNIKYTVLDAYRDMNRLKDQIDGTDEKKYDLIYTYGSTISAKVAKTFQKTPIVFNKVMDPVGYRIVESWDQKQPNLTGASIAIPIEIQIQKIQEALGIGNMVYIYNPLDPQSVDLKVEMETILEKKGVELISFEFEKNFKALKAYVDRIRDLVTCIYLPSEREVVGYIQRIFSDINRRKIPTVVTSTSTLKRGGLLCITADYYGVGKLAGNLAAQILKGANPADLPIAKPSESEVKVYANSAILKKFKMTLPKELNINYIK